MVLSPQWLLDAMAQAPFHVRRAIQILGFVSHSSSQTMSPQPQALDLEFKLREPLGSVVLIGI